MKISRRRIFFRIFISAAVFAAAALCFFEAAFSSEATQEGVVGRVIDGDTFDLDTGERIRLIGINSPEYQPWRNEAQFFGKEAADYARKILSGKKIRLESDIEAKDKYGRTLAYAYLEDGQFVNGLLVQEGYAKARDYPPNNRHLEDLNRAQKRAQKNKKGLWARPAGLS